jgi:hypothetical protein
VLTVTAAANFKLSLTLAEANTVRRALEKHRDAAMAQAQALAGDDTEAGREQRELIAAEAGRTDTIIRRDFR